MIWVLLCLTMQQLPINNSFIDKRLTKRWEVFGDSLKKAVEMHIPLNNSLEKLNIIVMGKSGAGKSTLINNVKKSQKQDMDNQSQIKFSRLKSKIAH